MKSQVFFIRRLRTAFKCSSDGKIMRQNRADVLLALRHNGIICTFSRKG